MVQCAGHIKSGAQCKRKAEVDTIFCWQHSDESEIKFLDKHPEQKIELPKVEKKIVNVIYKTNDLLGRALQAGILDRIFSFVDIPPETAKIFHLNISQKFNFIIKKLKIIFSTVLQWSPSTNYDTNLLYSLLTQKTKLTNQLVVQTLQKNVQYTHFYTAFINTIPLEQIADFLILLYKNKFFAHFKQFYVTFATRLNTFLLEKYGPKTEEFPFDSDYSKDVTQQYKLVTSLYHLENKVLRFLAPKTYTYDKFEFFENTYWEFEFSSYNSKAEAVELYLDTHKTSSGLKKYLGDLYYTTYDNITATWAYTVWKNFPKSENAVKSVVSCSTNVLLKSYKLGLSVEYQQFEVGLDLNFPITLSDIEFFNWLHKLFKEYSDRIYKDNQSFIDAFHQYVKDKVHQLNPGLWLKLRSIYV